MDELFGTAASSLAWALIDFLWQGLLVGWVAALLLALMRKARPQARYLVACGALLLCAALFPLTLTKAEPPETPDAPRLRPAMAWQKSPLAAAGVIVSGVTGAAFRMVGPMYGLELHLTANQIGIFLAAYVLGGALAQVPVGWAAADPALRADGQ